MENLYSRILPIKLIENTQLIVDAIEAAMEKADQVRIAVGYASTLGLQRLNELVKINNIQHVELVLGMYKVSGIPESIYNGATELHEQWSKGKIGSVYFVNNMNYHGKLYIFYKNGIPFKAISGSANLSVLAPEGETLRQYEVGTLITDEKMCSELDQHIASLITTSTNLADNLNGFEIIHERIDVLRDIESIMEITSSEVEWYASKQEQIQFRIPIKAPQYADRFSDQSNSYAKSNINVCYGKGRENKTSGKVDRRNWYETQITVAKNITSEEGYPKGDPFYLVTDDGYKFLAHSTAQNDKQLTAYGHTGNDRIFGRWIKGRLATAGYVQPYDDVNNDIDGDGIVTIEMLDKAHMRTMVLTKTDTKEYGNVYRRHKPTEKNKKGTLDKKHFDRKLLNVWTVHFEDAKED